MTTIGTRHRRHAIVAGVLTAALSLAACGGGGTPAVTGSSTAGYPITVDTQFGQLTLTAEPQRIVVLGSPRDVDVLAALGNPPLAYAAPAVTGEDDARTLAPWLGEDAFEQYVPGLFEDDFGPAREAIAQLDPDLIIFFGAGAPLDQQGYEQLAGIAPTYAYVTLPPWRDEITTIGTLVGKSSAAARLTKNIEAEFAKAREEVPGLKGRTFFHGVATPDGIYAVPAAIELFTEFGLEPAENQPVPPDRPQTFSRENLDQIDADVVFLGGQDDPMAVLKEDPRFAELPAVRNQAMIYLQPLLGKISIPSQIGPASVPWLLDRLVPELQKSSLSLGT